MPSARAIVRYFIELRKLIERYIESFPGLYDHLSVRLPPDRSLPQPIIKVDDGFRCKQSLFMTQDRNNIQKHADKERQKKRVRDKEKFWIVRIQS